MTGAIFLIGIGCLFYFGFWPGIIFLIAVIMVIRGIMENRSMETFQSAAWVGAFGVWSSLNWNVGALFILGGICMLIPIVFKSQRGHAKPKPDYDKTFE
jgi:TRAP-type C4-dicarboxylate transport system permease large subunit